VQGAGPSKNGLRPPDPLQRRKHKGVSKEQCATRGSEGRVIKKKFQYFMEMRDSSLLAPDGCFMHRDCIVLEFGRNNLIQVPY
jgi:hypothetical protein